MKQAWELTADEYVEQRIQSSTVNRECFLEHYPIQVLKREYLNVVTDFPRDAEVRFDVYDQLPAELQAHFRKFNFTLSVRLFEREQAKHATVGYDEVVAYLSVGIDTLKAKAKRNKGGALSKTDSHKLNRYESNWRELLAPFTPKAKKQEIVNRMLAIMHRQLGVA